MSGTRRDFMGSAALVRGDTFVFEDDAVSFTDGDLETPGTVLRATIKLYDDDDDPGLVQLDSESVGQIEILGPTSFRFVVPKATTSVFPLALLHYDVVWDRGPRRGSSLWYGRIECVADITRTTQ